MKFGFGSCQRSQFCVQEDDMFWTYILLNAQGKSGNLGMDENESPGGGVLPAYSGLIGARALMAVIICSQ